MSSESSATKKPRARGPGEAPTPGGPPPRSPMLRLLDWAGVGLFLALTFLLGAFPLKDTDFWWHLKTGDMIRQSGRVPTVDIFTFSVPPGTPWIDLHWIFQVALSWGYAHGGVVALNLAKCAITCVAVLLLVTARRRGWPVWAMLIAWLPALLVLGGGCMSAPRPFRCCICRSTWPSCSGSIDSPRWRSPCPWSRWRGSTRRACSSWARSSWPSP